jgi:hypothetical protein
MGYTMKNNDTMTEILIQLTKLNASVDENTRDLKYHIKRTDLLEKKTNYITYLLLIGAGASAPSFVPSILKVLGL